MVTLNPTPLAPKSSGAEAIVGTSPIVVMENPKSPLLPANAGVSRRRPTSETVARVPTMPPSPNAE